MKQGNPQTENSEIAFVWSHIYIIYPFLGFRLRIGNREYGTKKKESCLKWELEWNPTKASYLISSCPSLDFWVFSTCLFNSCIFHVSGATMWLRGRLGQAECRPSFQNLLVHQKPNFIYIILLSQYIITLLVHQKI